ncbi:MAG: DegT/DnrJ/EryC1/StrS aminotransferase family protein [Alcanivorax sp.]|nr:DegT/DnrJ/EryC1/StrS aminotransferase family protein [Alcanivorax sp.]
MLNTPFPPWPSFTEEEGDAVREVLLSNRVNYWTGEHGRQFEKDFAEAMGMPYGIALGNGTLALDLALRVLGVGAGDEVIVTPRTFLASATAIVNAGATPIFADIDPDSQNITPDTARQVLTPRTRAIMCVHLAGWPCDMAGFRALADEHGVLLIEDCAQAHGAAIDGQPVGSFGDAAAYSFCQDKIMTTGGEGGMLLLRSEQHWRQAWSFKDHGKDWDAVYNREHPPGFRWLHEHFGTNWRMTEMQAAIGRIQLQRLPQWLRERQALTDILREGLGAIPGLRVPWPDANISHACYKFYVFVRPEALVHGWDRDRIMAEVNACGVPCLSGSCSEVYLEKCFEEAGLQPANRLPIAQQLGETSLMFLVHPTLAPAHMEQVVSAVRDVMGSAARC